MRSPSVEKSMDTKDITDAQLEAINRYSRRPLERDELFVFSIILCDNEIDRDFEQFPVASLKKLAGLYIGKTGVFDHRPQTENQRMRIFDTRVVEGEGGEKNSVGEDYAYLKAWAYMLRCDKNSDLILEIDAGIKKEVSVGCAVNKTVCSICGADQKNGGCSHKKGRTFGEKLCYHLLLEPTDAYEWSFVAVPSQKNAGVVKSYGGPSYLNKDDVRLEKLFEASGDVTILKAQIDALAREYASLKSFAEAGEQFYASLRKEAVRAALLSQPDLNPRVMEEIAAKLDLEHLREFVRAFNKSAGKALPPPPQLPGAEDAASGAVNNRKFKI